VKRWFGFLFLGWVCLYVSQTGWAGQFKRAVYYPAGERPRRVVAANFTRSGNLDLAVANYLTSEVSILLGNGDGTFQKAKRFSVSAPIGIAVGDFNGDGKPDLAIIESGGTGQSTVAIFLNDGAGNFHHAGSRLCGIYSISVAVGDFNGDGNLDLAVANRGFDRPGNVKVFLGDGKGGLGKATTYSVAGGPYGIAVGDLNGDGHPDIATALDLGGSVGVLINDGTGHFLKPVTYNAGGGEVVDVKIADLRNDGRNDLVIADLSAGMVVLLNRGNGTFGKPTAYTPTFQNWQPPEACTVADFNLSGKLDVACAAQAEDSYLFYGKGDGTFGTAIAIADTIKNQGGYGIASGNFITGDNAPDLAIPIEEYGKVAIMLNTK
jgi:hypothetical protein